MRSPSYKKSIEGLPGSTSKVTEDDILKIVRKRGNAKRLRVVLRRFIEQERRAYLTAETLQKATAAINSSLELNRVLEIILEQLQLVIAYDSASLMLIEDGILRVLAVRGHPQPQIALQVRFRLEEDPLASWIAGRKSSLILRDAQQDERFINRGEADYVRGWLGAPLILYDQVIGILTLDSRKANRYTQPDADLVGAFATHAALAINNARLFQHERQQRIFTEVIREIGLLLSSSLRADQILGTILEQVGRVVPYDSASIFLLEEDRARVVTWRGYDRFGVDRFMKDVSFPLDKADNLKRLFETRQSFFIPDIQKESRWMATETSRHIRSWIGVPLIAQDQVLGFLSLDKTEVDFYTHEHASNLEMLAGHAALALRNALEYGEVELASQTDFLTGTFNRRYFLQQLTAELERARRGKYPLSLLMVDIDHYKRVNDSYGHAIGDQVLQMVVARIKDELRAADCLTRYGGEEFMVILPGTSQTAMKEIAERLRQAVAKEPFGCKDNNAELAIPVTISVGGATYPVHAQGAQELILLVDQALYQAKSKGRNVVCCL